MTTDATRCAKCGGEFSSKRVHIDGLQFHESCALSSASSHTEADVARMSAQIERLRAVLAELARAVRAGYLATASKSIELALAEADRLGHQQFKLKPDGNDDAKAE